MSLPPHLVHRELGCLSCQMGSQERFRRHDVLTPWRVCQELLRNKINVLLTILTCHIYMYMYTISILHIIHAYILLCTKYMCMHICIYMIYASLSMISPKMPCFLMNHKKNILMGTFVNATDLLENSLSVTQAQCWIPGIPSHLVDCLLWCLLLWEITSGLPVCTVISVPSQQITWL